MSTIKPEKRGTIFINGPLTGHSLQQLGRDFRQHPAEGIEDMWSVAVLQPYKRLIELNKLSHNTASISLVLFVSGLGPDMVADLTKKITKKAEYLARHMASSFSMGKGGRKVFSSLSE